MTKDVFAIVESLVKNQCKGNALKHFHFFVLLFVDFFHFIFSYLCKSMVFVCFAGATKKLMELKIRFPTHGVMNVLGIVYPQYWLQQDYDAFFGNRLQVLKIAFCCGKTICKVDEQEVQMHKLLYATDFNCQQGLFKLTMKSNAVACMVPPFDTNPLTRMWCLNCDSILDSSFQLP